MTAPFQQRHVDILARDIDDDRVGCFLESQRLMRIGNHFAGDRNGDMRMLLLDRDGMIGTGDPDWLFRHDGSCEASGKAAAVAEVPDNLLPKRDIGSGPAIVRASPQFCLRRSPAKPVHQQPHKTAGAIVPFRRIGHGIGAGQRVQHIGAINIRADGACGDRLCDQARERHRHPAIAIGKEFGITVEKDAKAVGHAAFRGDISDEAMHPFLQGLVRRKFRRKLAGGIAERLDFVAIDGLDQMLPAGEMAIERPDPDPGLPGDILERGDGAMAGKGLRSNLDQPVMVAARIGARAPAFVRHHTLLFRQRLACQLVLLADAA
ncbi:hypothetical protein RHSP_78514 [Rhizobium freirei PRF 81]|uniref:Uncharacterized protein n=1 Tax=Rhizobium freirei PRF 81 TaxID=363754 RepID=N6U1A2_9HYPH|nr:hypothetical protein RHSP_78514 [Rhizobium freirei PRF 81]